MLSLSLSHYVRRAVGVCVEGGVSGWRARARVRVVRVCVYVGGRARACV